MCVIARDQGDLGRCALMCCGLLLVIVNDPGLRLPIGNTQGSESEHENTGDEEQPDSTQADDDKTEDECEGHRRNSCPAGPSRLTPLSVGHGGDYIEVQLVAGQEQ